MIAIKYSGNATNNYYNGSVYNSIYNQNINQLNPESEHYMLVFPSTDYWSPGQNTEINSIKVIFFFIKHILKERFFKKKKKFEKSN